MKKYYIGIPAVFIIAFAVYFSTWAGDRRKIEEAAAQEAAALAAAQAQEKILYQERIQAQARAAAEIRAREKAEKEARDKAEEEQWVALNKQLETAIVVRDELSEKVYETTNLHYVEQERKRRVEESLRRAIDEKMFLAQYVPSARSNRESVGSLLKRAEELSTLRIAAENEAKTNVKKK